MNPTQLDQIRALIDLANILIGLLDTLLGTDRPQLIQRIVYIATKFYLQFLVFELAQIARLLALQKIHEIIRNQVFTGQNVDLARLLAIHDALVADCSSGELECLVGKTQDFTELNEAVKQRILAEVNSILATYNGAPSDGTTFSYDIADADGFSAYELYHEGIPFPYDRVRVANYAASTSRANFEGSAFAYGAGNLTTNSPKGVGSNLRYSTLTHIGAPQGGIQNTGSAYFISECLFIGGHLPMKLSDQDFGVDFCIGGTPSPLETENSWLLLCCASTNLEATYSWRDHRSLIPYLGYNDIDVDGHVIDFDELADYMRFDLNFQPHFGGEWRSEQHQTDGQAFLYSKFRESGFAELETGDYIYHNLGSNASGHGFLIVGWGDALNVPMALNARTSTDAHFHVERPRNPSTNAPLDAIPYVADFPYGYNGQNTGWLQDPRPRPFYASTAVLHQSQLEAVSSRIFVTDLSDYLLRLRGNYNRFVDINNQPPSGWRFFHIPLQQIRIPFTQLFQLAYPCQ